jgi:hypothetical protein
MTTLGPHADMLVAIISAGFAVALAIGLLALNALRSELKEQRVATAAAAKLVNDTFEKFLDAQTKRWNIHEEEHREFRRDMLALSSRLSHLEGEHAQRTACRVKAQDMGHGSD